MVFGKNFKAKTETDSTLSVGTVLPKQYKPRRFSLWAKISGDGQNIILHAYDDDSKKWQRSPKVVVMSTDPAGVNEQQTVTITGTPTGGTFTLTFGGQTTAGIAYNAAASVVQTALTGLSSIGANNATVTGSAGGPYTVTFVGAKGYSNVAAMTASGASLTGGTSPGVTVATIATGSSVVTANGIQQNDLWADISGGSTVMRTWTGTAWK